MEDVNDEQFVVDYQQVADDIRRLTPQQQVPFLAGCLIAGLMILPESLRPSVSNIKSTNLQLDNFELLCVLFGRNDKLREDFIEQTAEYAERGMFFEGPDQEGWNETEFEMCIRLLMLTLK